MTRVNNIFTSSIDGMTAYKKYGEIGKLDRKETSLSGRMDNINELLDEDNFFDTYYEQYYDPIIGQDSALSDENNVSQMLSSMADYLINSDESKELDKRDKVTYVFTEDLTNKREQYRQDNNSFDYIDASNVEIVSKPVKPVEFKSGKISVNKKDLQGEDEMNHILREYSDFISYLLALAEEDKSHKRKYYSMVSVLKDDMKMVKESYKGILPRSKSVPGGHYVKPVPSPDYTSLNIFKKMYNASDVSVETNYELWENSFDFEQILLNANITDIEYKIIKLKQRGFEFSEIVKLLDLQNEYESGNIELHIATNVMRDVHKSIVDYVEQRNEEVRMTQKVKDDEE